MRRQTATQRGRFAARESSRASAWIRRVPGRAVRCHAGRVCTPAVAHATVLWLGVGSQVDGLYQRRSPEDPGARPSEVTGQPAQRCPYRCYCIPRTALHRIASISPHPHPDPGLYLSSSDCRPLPFITSALPPCTHSRHSLYLHIVYSNKQHLQERPFSAKALVRSSMSLETLTIQSRFSNNVTSSAS